VTAEGKLTTIKPPARIPGLRAWPTDKPVHVRPIPGADRQEVLLDGEVIGEINFWERRVKSRVGRTNFVREHARRRTWEANLDGGSLGHDRRWEAVMDVIEQHQRVKHEALLKELRTPAVPSFAAEVDLDAHPREPRA